MTLINKAHGKKMLLCHWLEKVFQGDRSLVISSFQRRLPMLTFLLTIMSSTTSLGRFYHLDAPEIDTEKDRSDEYFNDVLSYRENPLDQFNKNHVSVLAGSLDAKRFYYEELIKYETCLDICLSIDRHKRQDTVLEDEQFEIAIKGNHGQTFMPGVLASLDSHKERADLGAMAALHLGTWKFDIELWSVDHYFNTKKKFSTQKFEKKPRSLAAKAGYSNTFIDFLLSYSQDFALEWNDQNYFDPNSSEKSTSYPDDRQISYRYEARNIQAEFVGREFPFYCKLSRDEKWEKLRTNNFGPTLNQTFHRNWTLGEFWWRSEKKSMFYAMEFHSIKSSVLSHTDPQAAQLYAQNISSLEPSSAPQSSPNRTGPEEKISRPNQKNMWMFHQNPSDSFKMPDNLSAPLTDSVTRTSEVSHTYNLRESALASSDTASDSISREVIGLRVGKNYQFSPSQGGLLDTTMHWGGERFHLKLGTHYIYHLSSSSSMRLIVTWDLDKALGNFKKKETIRPWGGGGFSLQADI